MASLKFIRKRISSVKNTQKITKAMQMVSAAKLRRAMDKAQASRPYEKELSSIVHAAQGEKEWKSPLKERRELKRTALIVISTDRGLCGSLNSNLFKAVNKFISSEKLGEIEIYAFGKKARDFFHKRGLNVSFVHLDIVRNSSFEQIQEIGEKLTDLFLNRHFDRVEVFYNQFRSALVQIPQQLQLLPFVEDQDRTAVGIQNFIFEPSDHELLNKLVPMLIQFRLYRSVLEAIASEHAARMTAMDSATKNAKDMIGSLTLQMNRARQAAITRELMEIIGGAEAISA